jgi:hypothetical protein
VNLSVREYVAMLKREKSPSDEEGLLIDENEEA